MIVLIIPKAWGAYARDTLSISLFEAGWQILQSCTCGFPKTDIPAKSEYDLYPCPERGPVCIGSPMDWL
jgi:hypothetical protein